MSLIEPGLVMICRLVGSDLRALTRRDTAVFLGGKEDPLRYLAGVSVQKNVFQKSFSTRS